MDEQIAVEYLNSLDKRAFMTMNEVDLANLVLKYKNELSKEKVKNRKAIEYINKYKNQNWYIESRFTEELLNLLQGVDKE